MRHSVSVVIPAKNEVSGLSGLLPQLKKLDCISEIIVVDDGSTDNTVELCNSLGVSIISHPYSKGNGAAVKSGARTAKGDVIVFMDGDGQHSAEDVPKLLKEYKKGYDMVVGSRERSSQAGHGRWLANSFYNYFSSWVAGHKIKDLTSGFRVVNAKKFREFIHLLPNGFSYPTTSTMAFFRAGYSVAYVSISVSKRIGNSHINILKDGIRFLLIIFKIGTLYSPLKIFAPASAAFFILGTGYYLYTFITMSRFTNMSMLLFITALLVFLMGLISEQITMLLYKHEK